MGAINNMKKQILLISLLLTTSISADPELQAVGPDNGIDTRIDTFTRRVVIASGTLIRTIRASSICHICTQFISELNEQIAYNILDEQGVKALRESHR